METLMDEVIMEILSWVPVKSLLRFRCVCKSWKSIILHPSFINLHLQRSTKNANIVLMFKKIFDPNKIGTCVMSCSKRSFMDNPLSIIADEEGHILSYNSKYWVMGSCNGLVCLSCSNGRDVGEYWVRFWNPATRLRSKKSPHLCVDFRINQLGSTKFGFGYDKSSDTYKVVAVLNDRNATQDSMRTQVKVYTMGDHCWRDIQRFPAFPIMFRNQGIFVSGTLNWLAIRNFTSGYNWDTLNIKQLVIVSLDLSTETYKQMLLPNGLDETRGLDEIANVADPTIGVLGDCLCLFHDYKRTHFVVWQMKEFGVEKSWIPFVNVSYEHLQINRGLWPWPQCFSLLPVCISENGDVWMLIDDEHYETILYNWRHDIVQHTGIPKNRIWIHATDYVQSLVQPR